MKVILDSKKALSRAKFDPHLHLTILKHDLTLLDLPGRSIPRDSFGDPDARAGLHRLAGGAVMRTRNVKSPPPLNRGLHRQRYCDDCALRRR